MKEERIKKLRKELIYLVEPEIDKEINANILNLENDNVDIKKIAKEIYLKRGVDITKIKHSFIDDLNDLTYLFKNKDKNIKKKMYIEIFYIIILIVLMKIPIDLVRDIGYEYIEMLSSELIYYNLWNLAFLIIYTVIVICALIIFIRNFNSKYKDTKEI